MSNVLQQLADDFWIMDEASQEFAAAYAADVARTLAGHWHAPKVTCTEICPMFAPKSAAIFRALLLHASTS